MVSKSDISIIRQGVVDYIRRRSNGVPGEYHYSVSGVVNLYSSCYALMTLHYLDVLSEDVDHLNDWAEYLLGWQDRNSGIFMGPELLEPVPVNAKHNPEHLAMHLSTTVLPCLDILGVKPRHPLTFSHKYLDGNVLAEWLHARDWTDAWLEGNNLLFMLQLLIYLRDGELRFEAQARIDQFFTWLDGEVDPSTGLWGTNGYCSGFVAMCGGYHQLLGYYYEGRKINSPNRLVDVTLALQHADGGFHPEGGGGACEDVDAVDILVNLYKLQDYRRPEIRVSLRNAARSILEKRATDGGFLYRCDEPFTHMGMNLTLTPPNQSNMFSTWFRVHALALISEVLTDSPFAQLSWKFNPRLSMGWHRSRPQGKDRGVPDAIDELRAVGLCRWAKSHYAH